VAIEAGGGNDSVSLLDGSSVSGSITLGHGDDTLVLTGSPVVSDGSIYAGTSGNPTSGYDTATFCGSGTFDAGLLSGFDKGLKTGIGTYSVPELPISVIEVSEGTLLVDSDYSFAPGGKYTTHVYPDGTCGVLQINGTAALAGDLDVMADHGVYLDGTEYGVLASDTVDGLFDTMNLPGSAVLTFYPEYHVDGLDIIVDVASFKTMADNTTEEVIGKYLDRLAPLASGALYNVIAEFQWLPESGFDQAFASLSPEQYGASSREYMAMTRKSFRTLQGRLDGIRKSIAFAPVVNGTDATGNLAGFTGIPEKPCGLWHKGFIESFYEEQSGVTRLLVDTGNFNSFGYDTTFGRNMVAGFGRDHAEVATTTEFTDGDGVVSGSKHFAYGSYMLDEFYVDLGFLYGDESYRHRRKLTVGALEGLMASEHDGESFSSYVETGKLLTFVSSVLQPFGSLEYVHFRQEGFTESGGGPLALKIEEKDYDMLVSNLGFSAAKMWALDGWTIMPEVSLAWRYNIEPADYSTTASLVSAPGEYFVIDGKEDATHALAIGASLDIANYGKFRSILDFNGELFTDENFYNVEWKLEYNW
jgi:outer membrane autotransporter protein